MAVSQILKNLGKFYRLFQNVVEFSPKSWKFSYSILNAWYFPPDLNCKDLVTDNMSSINTFRIVEACLLNKKTE